MLRRHGTEWHASCIRSVATELWNLADGIDYMVFTKAANLLRDCQVCWKVGSRVSFEIANIQAVKMLIEKKQIDWDSHCVEPLMSS